MIQYGDFWRKHRRHFHQYFREQAIPLYHSRITQGVRRMLFAISATPDSFLKHIRQ